MHTIVQRMVGACRHVTAHQWVALLLARLAIGFFFVMSGYNKLFVQGIGSLREEHEDVALLSPVPAKKRAKTKAKPVTSDDALFRLIGIGKSDIPGGVSGKKHEYLARAYRPH